MVKPKSPEKSKPEDKDPDKSPTKKQEGTCPSHLLRGPEGAALGGRGHCTLGAGGGREGGGSPACEARL